MKRKHSMLFSKHLNVNRLAYFLGTLFALTQLFFIRPAFTTVVYLDTTPEHSLGVAFSIDVRVDVASDMYGTAFDLIYDPEFLEVVDSNTEIDGVQPKISEGDLLNDAGVDTTILLSALEDEIPGNLVVGISRAGDVAGVDVFSDTAMLTVNFRPKKLGTTSIIFGNPGLRDPANSDISTNSWDGTDITIIPLSPGDIDGSGTINLQDAILACQITSEITPAEAGYKDSDINGDGKIGMEDAIYVLQSVAELRESP
ncbi:dockerin type I domain-containing protein [Thermodesulfobacteriota bacterium]